MCTKSAESAAAEIRKRRKMSTSTASITTVSQSNRNLQNHKNHSFTGAIGNNINCASGTIRIDNSQDNAKFENNVHSKNNINTNLRIINDKTFTAARRIRKKDALVRKILLTTFLVSIILIQQADTTTTTTSNANAINEVLLLSPSADNVSIAILVVAGQNIANAVDIKPEPTTNSTNSVKSTLPVTPITSSTMPPAFSLISAKTIINAPDSLPADDTKLLTPPLQLHQQSFAPPTLDSPNRTPLALSTLKTTKPFGTSESPIEIFTIDTATEGDDNAAVSLQPPPPSDVLIKGFSIPTFLPPYPAFAIANLPSYTSAPKAASMVTPIESIDPQDQLYLAASKQNSPAQNLSQLETNITVQMGNHAYLPCNVHRIMNKPISWVRLRDGHIVSVDQATFIADQRFQSIFQGEEDTWSLQIKYVQDTDEGWYECQVSSEPKISSKIYLAVVVPHTELIGDQNRFVKAGSKVALHCIVRDTLEPPTYIIWFRGKTQITNDNEVGWYTEIDRTIFGDADSNRNTIGSLVIPHVRKKDSGNYTCQPSNSAPVSVDLHVLSGEYSASAIMSTASSYKLNENMAFFLLHSMIIFVVVPKT
ncbi:uncharacterized protein dpr17 [Eurosta solidaginis]|uniref:uncharacterized protein dpr17 n=1 Tax=Eurosta solidaginis TaxID=178769 RepID=UPI003530FBF1